LAVIAYSERAVRDFERIFDFLATDNPALAARVVAAIEEAVSMLGRHPLIGRPAEHGLHELLISRGKTGYVALYRYLEAADVVLVLALRHQREAGYDAPIEQRDILDKAQTGTAHGFSPKRATNHLLTPESNRAIPGPPE
jgi:addiction module RelE/StbE family toxin